MKPAIDVYLGSPIEEESEKDFLSRLISDLRARGEDTVILANFHAGRHHLQVDFLIITSKCACHVELKNYTAPVEGTYNGPWKLRAPDGKLKLVGHQNPYNQAKNCKFAISDDLHALVEKDSSLPTIPAGKKFYKFIESVVCVFPEIRPGSRIENRDTKVRVKSYADLLDFLTIHDRNPGWHREHWITFAMHLGLVSDEQRTNPIERDVMQARNTLEEYAKRFSEIIGSNLHPLVPTKINTKQGLVKSAQLLDLFSKGTHCLVVGRSGTGKTHLFKHMALAAVRDNVVPILVRARDYSGKLSVLLDRGVAHSHPGTAMDLLKAVSKSRRPTTLVVDGFNECAEGLRETLIQDLRAFYLRFSIPIIISSQADISLPSELSGDKLEFKELSADEKKAIFSSYSKAQIQEREVERFCEAFQTSYEISLAAQCVEEIRRQPTRTSLFQAYMHRRCARSSNPSVTRRILCALAEIMGDRLAGSLSVGEVTLAAEAILDAQGASLRMLDEAFTCGLLDIGQGRCAFRHEMLGQFFEALAFVSRWKRTGMLAAELAKPRYRHLAEFVISSQSETHLIRECVETLGEPKILRDCLRGFMGELARESVSQDVCQFFEAANRELDRASARFGQQERVSGHCPPDLLTSGSIEWSQYDRTLMQSIGLALSDGLFFEEVTNLIRHTDSIGTQVQASRPADQAEKEIEGDNFSFRSLYVFTYADNRPVVPTSTIFSSYRERYWHRDQRLVERVLSLCEDLSSETPGVLCLICLALDRAVHSDNCAVARILPNLLRACWDTRIYNLRIDVLHLVTDFGRSVDGVQTELAEILLSLRSGDRNIFLSSAIVEALAACNLLPPLVSEEEISSELSRLLTSPESTVAQEEAYSAVSNIFEDVYDGLYGEAVTKLPREERVKLLTMASLGAPSYGMIAPGWALRELIRLDDPNSARGFERWATQIDPETMSTQHSAECYLLGVMGCARFMPSPPLLKSIDTPEQLAWQLYGEIIFWTHKPGLDEAKVQALCAPVWKRLQTEVPQAAVDPLMQLANASYMVERQESNPISDLFTRWREPIRQILERALDTPNSLTSLFARGISWISKEYPAFIIKTLGEVGNSHTVILLEPLVDSSGLGPVAVEAVRKLKARLV